MQTIVISIGTGKLPLRSGHEAAAGNEALTVFALFWTNMYLTIRRASLA
jgi:hypothetical protein